LHKLFAELIYCHCVALAPGLFSSVGVHIQHLLLVGLSAEWQRSNSDLSLTDFVYRTHILSVCCFGPWALFSRWSSYSAFATLLFVS